ncbi:MAG TPA: MaoC family dehydratase N-terminal domain-containing protein [Nocardioidaceae bacterium]|nr:MaoC family dehydratase N-terminal domain-containing protein [Nocardioidaceae bacterium]
MPLAPDLAGREFPPTPPYDVSRSQIAAFADAVGADDDVHRDPAAARAAGHPDVVAPPTFPMVVAFQAMSDFMADPDVGIELRNVVHSEQRFEIDRPIHAGDVLTATIGVETVRQAAGTSLIATRSTVRTVDGERVCVAYATLAHRAPSGDDA